MESLTTLPPADPTVEKGGQDDNRFAELLEKAGIEVLSLEQEQGLVRCPGYELHTSKQGEHDCIAYFNDGWPRLHCLHASCYEAVQNVNDHLQALAMQANAGTRSRRPVHPQNQPQRSSGVSEEMLERIKKEFPWNYQDMLNDSRGKVNFPPEFHHLCILSMFKEDDIVWTGRDVYDTGTPSYIWRFRSAGDWMDDGRCPGLFTCPSTFKRGVYSRSAENVEDRRFLVVESDRLEHDEVGAVFRWLEALGHPLRAVVDTANKSLHGWFDYPPPRDLEVLKDILPSLKCDPKMFQQSQPCRLPGAIRKDDSNSEKYQRLIYFRQ